MKTPKIIVSFLLVVSIVFSSITCSFAVSPSDSIIPEDAVEFNGHYYKYYDDGCTWKDAKERCEKLGGHLITVTSKEEDDFACELINNGSKDFYWLGTNDEAVDGIWVWLTGEPWIYTRWSTYFDNGYGGKEDYAALLKVDRWGKKNQWNDFTNDGSADSINDFGYICEWGDYSIEFDYEKLKEFEHFKAWTYTLSENSMFNTQLNRELSYDLIIEDTTKAADFFSMAWQATTSDYLTDPSQYYEIVLMDILMQQLNSPDYAKKTFDDVKDLTLDYSIELFGNSVDDAYSAYETAFQSDVGHSSIVWEMEDEFQKKLDIYNVGVTFNNFVEVADTVGEVIEYVSKAIKIASAKKELIAYYTLMLQNYVSNNGTNVHLIKALTEIISIFNADFTVSAADFASKKASEIFFDGCVELITKHFPALGSITYVWKAGSILSNVACGTNVVAEARLTMSATKQISDLMKITSKHYLDSYLFDTGSLEKAKTANFSYEILTTVYVYGSNLAEKYYEAVFEGGLVNINKIINSFSGKRKATAEDTLKWVKHMSDGLEELKELPNEIRNLYNLKYHRENASRLGIEVDNVKHSIEIVTGLFVDAKDSIKHFFDESPIDLPYAIGEYVAPHIRLENWYIDSSCLKVFDPITDTATKSMAIYAKYIYDYYIEETSEGEAKIISYSNPEIEKNKSAKSRTSNNSVMLQNTTKTLEVPAYYCGYEITTICKDAFPENISLQYDGLIIYDTVTTIEDGAFDNWGNDFIIYCDEDSEAEKYAIEHGINYKTLEETKEPGFFEKIINAIKAFFKKIIIIFQNIF